MLRRRGWLGGTAERCARFEPRDRCRLLLALKFVAGKAKVKIPEDAKVTATVGIGPRDDGGGFGIDVALAISVPGVDRKTVEDLVKQAHVVCPYSHATKGSLDVRLSVV